MYQSWRCMTTSTALSNASAYGLRGYVDTLSPSLLCISMDRSLRVRRFFLFSMQRFPKVASWARSMRRCYAWVEHKELWAVIVIQLTTNVLFWFGGIVGWSGPDQPYMSTHMRPVPPTDMQLVLHKGVCFSYFSWIKFDYGRSLKKVKTTNLMNHCCGFCVGNSGFC